MGRKRTVNCGLPPNLYINDGYYWWRNPKTRRGTGIGRDRDRAIKIAIDLNADSESMKPTLIDRIFGNLITSGPWIKERLIPDEWFKKHAAEFLFCKSHIVRNSTRYKPRESPKKPGVYFIVLEGEIVYIGISTRSIYSRMLTHNKSLNGMAFNCFYVCSVPSLYLKRVEEYYISSMKPKLNIRIDPISAHLFKAHSFDLNA